MKLRKEFLKYVSLNVFGMIGISCYILADTFFVAKALGATGLAALNFSISFFSVMQGCGLMIGIGGATDFSLRRQEADGRNGDISFVHTVILGCIAAAVFLCIGLFLAEPLGRLLGADAVTLPYTQVYLRTILSFAPAFILNNILLAFVRNDNDPKLSMTAMLVSSFSNIILDYIFMFPLSMGIFGAAFATGLSPMISIAILLLHFKGRRHGFHLIRCKVEARRIGRIMALGFSSLIGELASAISLLTFNLIILGIAGNIGVAAYGIIANIALVATSVFTGTAQGLQPLASRCYGEGKRWEVSRLSGYAVKTAVFFAALIYAVICAFAPSIAEIFNSEGNRTLSELAVDGMRIYFAGYFFAGISIVTTALLSATAHVNKAMAIAICRSCVILVPCVFLLSRLLKMTGVWLSFVVAEGLVFVLTVVFLAGFRHRQN